MKTQPRSNKKKGSGPPSFSSDPYLVINLIFAGIVLVILVYSGIFSARLDNHPIPSLYEKATGQPSPSSGLSKSFSEIVRFRFESARSYNAQGIRIFSFFALQLLIRIASFILLYTGIRRSRIILADVILSAALFVICFRYYICLWVKILTG